jgi:hypothetical protein
MAIMSMPTEFAKFYPMAAQLLILLEDLAFNAYLTSIWLTEHALQKLQLPSKIVKSLIQITVVDAKLAFQAIIQAQAEINVLKSLHSVNLIISLLETACPVQVAIL